MVTDHTKVNMELKTLASQKGATLPTELNNKEKRAVERLQKLSGKEFDKAYISDMVRDHKKDVKEFEKASKNLSDPELKAFAENKLPTLQEHLRQAENLQAQLKGK